MKLKINKKTIEIILWLLGELVTIMKQVSKENKGNRYEEDFNRFADSLGEVHLSFLALKRTKHEEENTKNPEGIA